MRELEEYVNQIIGFSPLICNLFYFRDFLTAKSDKISERESENNSIRMTKDNYTPNLTMLQGA
jgi:hypothetical protein